MTCGARVKMCYVEVELPKGEVVGGLGCGGAGLGYAGAAAASAASASFLFLQTEIKGQKVQRDWRGLKLGRKLI